MKTPKQKPFSLPKVMYAVVCSENGEVVNAFSRKNDALDEMEWSDYFKVDSCTHKVVKVSVKKVK